MILNVGPLRVGIHQCSVTQSQQKTFTQSPSMRNNPKILIKYLIHTEYQMLDNVGIFNSELN